MAKRVIRTNDDACLYQVCRPVVKYDEKLGKLLDDMLETMYDAEGVGLAAPQIGILRRAVVIDTGEGPVELINPRILSSGGEQGGLEGCLSFPGKNGYVVRPNEVTVEGYDRSGVLHQYSGDGLFARAVFHELDHLDGLVYLRLVTEPPEESEADCEDADE